MADAIPAPHESKRVLVIANPIAGAGRGRSVAEALGRELTRAGMELEIRLTSARGDAQAFAANARAQVVVSVGGDGTLNEVLRGMADTSVPIGIVPLGTANVLARDLRLSADPIVAARTILAGHTVGLDTAIVAGQLSFLVVGVGFDAEAVRRVEAARRGPIHFTNYVRAGFGALWSQREPRLEVEIDGARLPGTFGWVLVSNVIHYGGLFRLAADRELDDGLWEVYLFRRGTRRHMVAHLLRGLFGRLPCKDVERLRARRVRIQSAEPVAVQVDGDGHGATPVELEISGPRFRILCPKSLLR